jgi:hypothetical protein
MSTLDRKTARNGTVKVVTGCHVDVPPDQEAQATIKKTNLQDVSALISLITLIAQGARPAPQGVHRRMMRTLCTLCTL